VRTGRIVSLVAMLVVQWETLVALLMRRWESRSLMSQVIGQAMNCLVSTVDWKAPVSLLTKGCSRPREAMKTGR
jgi:hypothetical protein